MRFLNASVLPRKGLNRNLSWGFPLGNLLPKTRVLKHHVLERKRRPNANASVLGTQHFRTLRCQMKCPKYCFGHFLICLNSWFREFLVWTFGENGAHFFKVLMTFGDFWVGMSKTTEKQVFFFFGSGRVHSWVFGCLARMGKTQIWAILLWCILKKGKFSKVCLCRKTLYLAERAEKWQNFHLHPFRFVGPNLHENVFFVGVMLGWWCCFLCFLGPPHLALNPPCFCWFVFGFLGVLGGVFLWFGFFVCFCFENKTNPFFLKMGTLAYF